MSRKLIIIAAILVALGLTLVVVYAKKPIVTPVFANRSLQTVTGDVAAIPLSTDIAGQPEAIKLARRIGGVIHDVAADDEGGRAAAVEVETLSDT